MKVRLLITITSGTLRERVISLNPNFANAYYNRGAVKYNLGDKKAAIIDWTSAAELYRQQGANKDYKEGIDRIEKYK